MQDLTAPLAQRFEVVGNKYIGITVIVEIRPYYTVRIEVTSAETKDFCSFGKMQTAPVFEKPVFSINDTHVNIQITVQIKITKSNTLSMTGMIKSRSLSNILKYPAVHIKIPLNILCMSAISNHNKNQGKNHNSFHT